MKKEDIIVNSIAFLKDLQAGKTQEELLADVHDLGFRSFEVRREFINDRKTELSGLKKKADSYGISLFYSVNEDLFVNSKVNPLLPVLFEEARVLAAPFIKLNTGDSQEVTDQELKKLSAFPLDEIGIRVENNQTPCHASLANCQHTMNMIGAAALPISFVFDTGNWAWVHESIEEAKEALASVTTYLHCKNYKLVNNKPQLSVSLFEGELDIRQLTKAFPSLEYLALEYPSTPEGLRRDVNRLIGLD
ncbi:sugar phosphate isomerase/epimerase family protein [Streptococcus dentasini]